MADKTGENGITGATIGMFDGVHTGHRHLLEQLRDCCDNAVVVTFSNHPMSLIDSKKAPKLLSTPDEKIELLENCGVLPVIMEFDDNIRHMTAREFVTRLARDYGVRRLVLGFNNSIGSDRCSGADDMRNLSTETGVEILTACELPGEMKVNSTTVRNMIAANDIEGANALLQRRYPVSGIVVHGKALGRQLGFPTANIKPESKDKLIPPEGVYAADAILENGDSYRAVVNIGRRPTVDGSSGNISIEAYLDGFNGNIYGKRLTVEFISFLRHEQKFQNINELRQQIADDLSKAKVL